MDDRKYLNILAFYEDCLARHGDSHLGVGWPKQQDVLTRYRVMLDIVRPRADGKPVRVLDFGCGPSHLYEYMLKNNIQGIEYAGLDISEKFIEISRRKFPANCYFHMDMLANEEALPMFDYVVMNGVFTVKTPKLSFEEMFEYFKRLVTKMFYHAERGIAFNLMSKQVDWERDDLFHLPLDTLAGFLTKELSRHFIIRSDYGLYEYTAYLYHADSEGADRFRLPLEIVGSQPTM
jgi:SAM-dependent methyltransferase